MNNMPDRETVLKESQYVDEILDVVDHADDFTRSDLQGVVEALVRKIMQGR